MAPSTSSSSLENAEDNDEDDVSIDDALGTPPATTIAGDVTEEDVLQEDASDDNEDRLDDPTFTSLRPIISTIGTTVSLTAVATAAEVGKKRKEAKKTTNKKGKKAKKTTPRTKKSKRSSNRGSAVNPHEIDGDGSWQASMLDIKRGEVELEQEKWDSQKQQQTLDIRLQQEKWKTQKQQQNLEYQFDLMVKYKKLQEQGFDNHQIVKMIPDMRPIIGLSSVGSEDDEKEHN